jgi:anthranilate synthase component 1/salicylate synthetase
VVLAIDHDGDLDPALVLRSLYRKQGRSWLQVGAGIVAQSTPARESEETCEKLNSVAQFLVSGTSPVVSGVPETL